MDETRQFFGELLAHMPDDHTCVVWVKGADEKRTSYSLHPESAANTAGRAEGDCYTGVALASPGASKVLGPKRRPGLAHVGALLGLWCDLDVNGGPENKIGGASSRDVAHELIKGLPVEPTMLVDSGYGLQPWWLFDEPWLLGSDEERHGAGELAARWYEMLRGRAAEIEPGFGIDSTHDLSRVLRVPGTFNHKGGRRQPVRLLELNDARYQLEALAELVAHVPAGPQLRLTQTADEIVVQVRPDGQPPFEKFEALAELEPRFKQSWQRTRDGKEWSASEYDASLASYAAQAEWADQEIVDLLVAARRKHGDDLKRPDYYARTIARTRARGEQDARAQERQAAIDELTEPAVTAGDVDRQKVLSNFSKVIGVPAHRWVQYGRDPDDGGMFELVIRNGRGDQRVNLGTARQVLDPKEFQARLMVATGGHVMIVPKHAEWHAVIGRLQAVADVHDSPEENPRDRVERWLEAYLHDALTGDRQEALRDGWPHEHDGDLYLVLESFRTWLRTRYGERLDHRQMQARLTAVGFRPEKVSYRRRDGASSSRHCYVRKTRRLEVVA